MPGIPSIAELIAQLLRVKISPGERTKLLKWIYAGLGRGWRKKNRPFKVAIGAVVLIGLSWWMIDHYLPTTTRNERSTGLPVSHPTLTLMNGSEVWLDTLSDGRTIEDDGFVLQIMASRTIHYLSTQPPRDGYNSAQPLYHAFKIPYGQSWTVRLLDGSDVQLKPGAELLNMVYPRAETSIRRVVILRGEAYFDIVSDKRRPFTVTTTKGVITVLGTRFDVFADERADALRAILLKGSIKVDHNDKSVTLRPGQEARVDRSTKDSVVVRAADTALSWRGDQFDFRGKNIRQMMDNIEEWYGLGESLIGKNVDTVHLEEWVGGHISKTLTLEQFLNILKNSKDIDCSYDGKRITVTRKYSGE